MMGEARSPSQEPKGSAFSCTLTQMKLYKDRESRYLNWPRMNADENEVHGARDSLVRVRLRLLSYFKF